jgi:predicted SAM-dependent methyltransferase
VELLIGAGSKREKHLCLRENWEWSELVTLDINPDHNPDVVWDLTNRPLPFEENTFDEIHAYEVIEHLGQQGDYRAWFAEWEEWWRLLKPGGTIFATSPHWSSPWAWGDPGHTRVVGQEILTYLVQPQYEKQVGVTAITDYRFCYRADFDLVHAKIEEGSKNFQYVMRAVKPSRISLPESP